MESKLRQEDTDEWFYESLKRYKNLFMFELEAPVDTIDIVDDTSLCITGIQNYSKKCEILQLSIPPKLLPKDMEDGLCKDRDFKIISGGYSSTKITHMKPIALAQMVAAIQQDQKGVALFHLGDYDHGVITEGSRLTFPHDDNDPTLGVLATRAKNIVFGDRDAKFLIQWSVDETDKGMALKLDFPCPAGGIEKIKYWDDNNIVSCCTKNGMVCNFDLREQGGKPTMVFSSSKARKEGESSTTASNNDDRPIAYSFDTVAEDNLIGLVDSCSGLEIFDSRNSLSTSSLARMLIPSASSAIVSGRFNLEFHKCDENNKFNFIVNGLKRDTVEVYQYRSDKSDIIPLFTHDGHTKTVTHALWHRVSENLLFSASADSLLHAWQYIVSE